MPGLHKGTVMMLVGTVMIWAGLGGGRSGSATPPQLPSDPAYRIARIIPLGAHQSLVIVRHGAQCQAVYTETGNGYAALTSWETECP